MSELKKHHFPVTVFLFLLVSWISLNAQYKSEPDIIRILPENRIPVDNQNWEISQDPVSGYMYFANSTGLVQYNGLSAVTYDLPGKHSIRSVYADDDGSIYTGSYEEFGVWKDNGKGELIYHSLSDGIEIPKNDEIWNILELNDTLFFQSFTTIYACFGGKVTTIASPSIMLFMFRAGNSFIVQALGKGLFFFNGRNFAFIPGSEIFSAREILSIMKVSEDSYWICTARDGLYKFSNNNFSHLNNLLSDYLKIYSCNAGVSLNDSVVVFGTILNGLVFANPKGEILKTFNYANGLNNNTVLSLYKDKESNIWAGLDEGVACISSNSPYTLFTDRRGTLGTIYTVMRKGDLIYFGTNHGLFVADVADINGEYSFLNLGLVPQTQGQVWKLYEFGDDLFCGHNDGTFIVKGRSIEKISEITGGWAFTVYRDILLQGTYTGIAGFKKVSSGKWHPGRRIEGFNQPTRYIETDYLGYVWAVHPQKGIYRLELNENADSVISRMHFPNIEGKSGRITLSVINNQVVFMNTINIYSFDPENRRFFQLKSLESGLKEYIRSTQIIHYEKNSYWFILGNKIALFDISRSSEAKKLMELMQEYTELPELEQQIVALDNQYLLIPTRQAFTLFNVASADTQMHIKPPEIVRLAFFGKSGNRVIKPGTGRISVSNNLNNLTVYVAHPFAYGKGEKEITYRISEIDSTWRFAQGDNFSCLNLKYGTYTAEIRSSAGTGINQFTFIIKRPWFLSIVAWLCYFTTLVLLFIAGRRIFKIELNRQRKMIEFEVKKKRLESELDYKSYELMLTMRYLIRKTEILKELQIQIDSLKDEASKYPVKYVREMERIINEGLNSQTEEWKSVMNNLKLSQEGFFRRLKEKFPGLTPNDLRLCSYLRMNFTTKEIAHLLNISGRAVEIGRYRLRSKMKLDHSTNLTEFLIAEAEK
ncbi:MAG TPA: hypothetical protein VHI78_03220 [Bacteroidales bacterium]|nr:hypothetical protein [Bacteroidales bacterium]